MNEVQGKQRCETKKGAARQRMKGTDRLAGEEVAAEGCDCRRLRFSREEQQRYQWPTTAGPASSREQRLMNGEHDRSFSTVQSYDSLHDT